MLFKQRFIVFDGFEHMMKESEIGNIPSEWDVKNLQEVIENYDRKRKPLSSRQRQEHKGKIPYYGATSIMDFVDEFIFNDIYVLLGEDGSVVREDGTPFLQYIWGKSWINNHAHVLKGTFFSTEILYLYLLKMNVSNIVTGAVQLKISQGNMNSVKIACAPKYVYKNFDKVIQPIFANIRNNEEKNKNLIEIRDALLSKLMVGVVDITNLDLSLSN